MKKATTIKAGLAAILAICATAGYLTAPGARAAVQTITLNVHAGTEMGTPDMTCGWHTSCVAGNYGAAYALDWQNDVNWPVHWHSYAKYTGIVTNAGSGVASNVTQDNCKTVRVRVNRPNSTLLGDVFLHHSDRAVGGTFVISAGPILIPAWTSRAVGQTVATDTCTYNGYHLHQGAGSPFARNTTRYSNAPSQRLDVDITALIENQNYVNFQY